MADSDGSHSLVPAWRNKFDVQRLVMETPQSAL